jgi:hypothetical protein
MAPELNAWEPISSTQSTKIKFEAVLNGEYIANIYQFQIRFQTLGSSKRYDIRNSVIIHIKPNLRKEFPCMIEKYFSSGKIPAT